MLDGGRKVISLEQFMGAFYWRWILESINHPPFWRIYEQMQQMQFYVVSGGWKCVGNFVEDFVETFESFFCHEIEYEGKSENFT
jgi:hypothetical protein